MARSLGLVVDPTLGAPLYQQLFDRVVERIRSGAFPPGYRLPPTRTLAKELGTHRNTIVRAYGELEEAGFLSSTVGRGTFVRAQPAPVAVPANDPPSSEDEPSHVPTALPWSSLLADRSHAEAFARFHRITRGAGRGEYINLTRMQPSPDLVPDELFRRCIEHVLRTMGARSLAYAPHEGVPRLREQIALDLARQGVPARSDDVLVTSGSQQGIDVIARGLLEAGDTVLSQSSTYTGAIQVFAASGARLEGVPSDDQGPQIAAATALSRGRCKAFYLLPNHCNPTGECITEARRRELVRWSRERGVPLIEDDYAADLELDGVSPPPALRALDGDVLYLGTYSKKLFPALRVGFVLYPASLGPHLVALKHTTDLGGSAVLQHALAEFLERGYLLAHLNRIRPEYRMRRDALAEALRRHLPSSMTFEVPPRGVTLWLPLPEGIAPEHVFEEAKRRGLLVSPGTLNRVAEGRAGIRVTYCNEPIPRLVEGARRLGQVMEALSQKKRAPRAAHDEAMGMV